MKKSINTLLEEQITHQVKEKAEELGVTFKIKCRKKQCGQGILLRMKREPHTSNELVQNQHAFADHVANLVLGTYANDICFSYPSKL